MPTLDEKKEFLEKDLYNSLRWLFVSAVTWQATKGRPEHLLAMYSNFVEARSLYEFYYTKGGSLTMRGLTTSRPHGLRLEAPLYRKYMDNQTPAQKRVFHLVYGRSTEANAGGPGHEHPDHLKNQVLKFAQNLRYLTQEFIKCVKPEFRGLIQSAFDNALIEAKTTAGPLRHPQPDLKSGLQLLVAPRLVAFPIVSDGDIPSKFETRFSSRRQLGDHTSLQALHHNVDSKRTCAVKRAIRFEPICAKSRLFDTNTKRVRAGWLGRKRLI